MTDEQFDKMLAKHDIAITALENLGVHHDAMLARIEEAALNLVFASKSHDAALTRLELASEGHDEALSRIERLVEASIKASKNGGSKNS